MSLLSCRRRRLPSRRGGASRHGAAVCQGGGGTPFGDDGRIMVLTLGMTVIFLLIVTAVVSISGVHLQRTRLHDLADTLALAGADSMSVADLYGGDGRPRLTDAEVSRAVHEHLAAYPGVTAGLDDVEVVVADSPDGVSARVVLRAQAPIALLSPVTDQFSDGVTITAQATAQAW